MTTQVFKLSLQGKTYDSGVLLAGGQYILTAAHLFNTDASPSDLIINANAHATAIYIVSLRWYALFNNTKITVKLSTYQS
jgi:hypothetical protein